MNPARMKRKLMAKRMKQCRRVRSMKAHKAAVAKWLQPRERVKRSHESEGLLDSRVSIKRVNELVKQRMLSHWK